LPLPLPATRPSPLFFVATGDDPGLACPVLRLRLLLLLLAALLATDARTYRGLETCPDLTPLESPVLADRSARRCSRVVAKASQRHLGDQVRRC